MQNEGSGHLGYRLAAAVSRWLRGAGPAAEVRALEASGDMERIAADLGLETADLRRLIPLGSDAAALLPHMMTALDLDPEAVPLDVMRDLERTCALCGTKAECADELLRGSADATYVDFCPNAPTLRALQLEPDRQSGGR